MKTVFYKLSLLLAPLLIWQGTELFLLPIDAFTFRAWETMSVYRILTLPGPFYPNMTLTKWSAGDANPRGPRGKLIRFSTDQKGFRNDFNYDLKNPPDILLVGDSNVVGSHIDQENILSVKLSQACNCSVYNAGSGLPTNIVSVLRDRTYVIAPPKAVVLEIRRGDLVTGQLRRPEPCEVADSLLATTRGYISCGYPGKLDQMVDLILRDDSHKISILLDRVLKQPSYNLFRARARLTGSAPTPNQRNPPPEREKILKSIEELAWYRDQLKARGIALVVVVLPSTTPVLDRARDWAIPAIEELGIPTLGFLPTSQVPNGVDIDRFFLKDDSHWTEEAINLTAQGIAQIIRNKNVL